MPPADETAEILRGLWNRIPSVPQSAQEQVKDLLGRDILACSRCDRWLRCNANRNRVILSGKTVDKLFERLGRFGAVNDDSDWGFGRRRLLGRGQLREESDNQQA